MFPEITVTELIRKAQIRRKIHPAGRARTVRVGSCQNRRQQARDYASEPPFFTRDRLPCLKSVRSQEIPVYVLCHHGSRSMQVTMWLAQQGYKNIFNVRGGIDEYARSVDSSVGFY
jgi:rhodanese-related sulfurtransferase